MLITRRWSCGLWQVEGRAGHGQKQEGSRSGQPQRLQPRGAVRMGLGDSAAAGASATSSCLFTGHL